MHNDTKPQFTTKDIRHEYVTISTSTYNDTTNSTTNEPGSSSTRPHNSLSLHCFQFHFPINTNNDITSTSTLPTNQPPNTNQPHINETTTKRFRRNNYKTTPTKQLRTQHTLYEQTHQLTTNHPATKTPATKHIQLLDTFLQVFEINY